MTAPFRFPKFFVTSPTACPYLPGRTERKVFTELNGVHAAELNDALGRIGFRRSQGVAYRPSCASCSAFVSVRVLAEQFVPGATQRKLQRRNADLEVSACKPWTTEEQYALLRRYLAHRHPGGGMAAMDEDDFEDYDREVELALYREYRDVVSQFRYVVETERRFYLANEVDLVRRDTEHDFYFEISMQDVWVWDIYRADRFVKSVRVLTFKDVNVEELQRRDFQLPEELSLD